MMTNLKYIFTLLTISISVLALSQNEGISKTNYETTNNQYFTVKGSIIERDSYKPISGVTIEVNGGTYTRSDLVGDFRIEVKKGDELIIRHPDFETVYYTIKDDERIRVEVEPQDTNYENVQRYKKQNRITFNILIDSATHYLKKDAQKSIQFITNALEESKTAKQNAEAYKTLADVNYYLQQYDLAISNYQISLQSFKNNDVVLKLADTYLKNKEFQKSFGAYKTINVNNLSKYQSVLYYEGLGDVYFNQERYNESILQYKTALTIAQQHHISPKITDLNSKLGLAYNNSGQLDEAEDFFDHSLNLAETQNKTRSVREKITVADAQNRNQSFDKEIQLRKDAIKDIEDIDLKTIKDDEKKGYLFEGDLTTQKQNYKIGRAYALQKDYDNAITYLEESIKEANLKNDLIVEKDATRRISEIYDVIGDSEKALSNYKAYTKLVDTLYIRKEQEIAQVARFNRDLATKQNRITSLETDRKLTTSKIQLSQERNRNQLILIYSLIVGLVLLLIAAYFMYKAMRQQKLANNLLALKSLRSQMNPHFIFNALNSVNSFIATNDERTANKYLTDFSKLMRSVLENSDEDFIPLSKEIQLLELYIKLEHFRFQDKFDYNITVEEHVNIDAFVIPPMLLQPYIENAVWHGLRYKNTKGYLDINIAQHKEDEIKIIIKDNGIGRQCSKDLKTDNQKKQTSKGMSNIKKRVAILNEMYKDKVDVFISDLYKNQNDTGTQVVVILKKD